MRNLSWSCLFFIFFELSLLSSCVFSKQYRGHQTGEDIIVYDNVVTPFFNPQESYKLHDSIFCHQHSADDIRPRKNMGFILQGYLLTVSNFKVKFITNMEKTNICALNLTAAKYDLLVKAVNQQYVYQLFIEDLYTSIPVGKLVNQMPNIYTHLAFEIYHNGRDIVSFNVIPDVLSPLVNTSQKLEFSYSVMWAETGMNYESRMNQYYEQDAIGRIRWHNLLYSVFLPVPWFGFVLIVLLRIHRRDAVLDQDDEESSLQIFDSSGNEFKWKNIHGDVFRTPPYLMLFSAAIGTGAQLFAMAIIFTLLFKNSYFTPGYILSYIIIGYMMMSFIGGYVSGGIFFRNNGRRWVKNAFTTATLFPGFTAIISLFVNMVISPYNTTSSISYLLYLTMLTMWATMVLPLTLFGAFIGRHWTLLPSFACRVNPVPRIIPEVPWYSTRWFICLIGGFITFISFNVELHTIFNAIWSHKYYRILSYLPANYITLCLIICFSSITLIYWLIRTEDYRWHWVSFMSGASISIYTLLYLINFYIKRHMFGTFQATYYFGYSLILCLGFGLMGGFISFYSCLTFIQYIYKYIKVD